VVSLVALACLLYVIASNLAQHDPDRWGGKLVPVYFEDAARFARLDQRWGMFAPMPPVRDFWFVMVGRTVSKKDVNLWTGSGAITDESYEKPKRICAGFNSNRWHKYLENMTLSQHQRHRQLLMLYLCHRYNAGRSESDVERVSTVSLWVVNEITLPERIAAPTTENLGAIRCPGPTPAGFTETLLPPVETPANPGTQPRGNE